MLITHRSFSPVSAHLLALVFALVANDGCSRAAVVSCPNIVPHATSDPTPSVSCQNEQLTAYSDLLVIAPHPDDEILGFAGLISDYMGSGKSVRVVIVTDGNKYQWACGFWKNPSAFTAALSLERGTIVPCTEQEQLNFATKALDSFAEIRRQESIAAAQIIGSPVPKFLGYPDRGISRALTNVVGTGEDRVGAGDGATLEQATALKQELIKLLDATGPTTLVATTHPLDQHPDHRALGELILQLNAELTPPRRIALSIIHAGDDQYPEPAALLPLSKCIEMVRNACLEKNVGAIQAVRNYRLRPRWPQRPPAALTRDPPVQLCLDKTMYELPEAKKLRAIEVFASETGHLARTGEVPLQLRGLVDCSGYLFGFVRRTEVFFLR